MSDWMEIWLIRMLVTLGEMYADILASHGMKCFFWLDFKQCDCGFFFFCSQGLTAGFQATVLYDGVTISGQRTNKDTTL